MIENVPSMVGPEQNADELAHAQFLGMVADPVIADSTDLGDADRVRVPRARNVALRRAALVGAGPFPGLLRSRRCWVGVRPERTRCAARAPLTRIEPMYSPNTGV